MPLPRVVEETDEDFDSVHHALHDTSTSSETSPPSAIFSLGNAGTEDEDPFADAFFETESGMNVLDDIEPIEDNKSTEFATGTRPLFLKRTPTTFSTFSNFSTISDFSTFSNGSVLSTRSTGRTFPLRDLCEKVIEKHLWLQMARIVSASCYSQSRNLILHRFLILQLRRPGRNDIWLRIDRRAGLGILSLVRKLGTTPAHDTVQLSASKEALAKTARQENMQEFKRQPFLADFGEYLRVISEELLEYKIWPENCWMFCSLLQDHLEGSGDGYYTFGRAVAPDIAPSIRGRISERAAAQVTPNTIMTVLQNWTWALSRSWQPFRIAWDGHSIAMILAKIVCAAQGSEDHSHTHDISERIDGASVAAHLEKSDLHSRIAMFCIDALGRLPEGNVLQLPNPLILNSDMPDLAFRIQSKISEDVQYAALYGLLHVAEIKNPSAELFSRLETFIAESVIKWLEVLSLLEAARNALIALERVIVWCQSQSHRQLGGQNLAISFLRCRRFAYQYYGVISVSAGHIAHSAPSHSPDAGWQRRHHGSSYEHLPAVQWQDPGWDGCLNTIRGHTSWVYSVSFSPDGSKVASGSMDTTGRIWDAVTGEALKVLRGHAILVCSVSFSPDGSKVASGSADRTGRIWDAVTGEELKILRGHTEWVRSVSFSLDGSKVASGSNDNTGRIWDAATGEALKVLRGHTDWVRSVSFSLDGSKVASGSDDKTGRIWDAVTGEELKVLRGHTESVYSVSFSSDGSRVASASGDHTVRIWDAATGEELKVLQGHTELVRSVAFSSDESRVASASDDKTVRIWVAVTGEELKVLRGHTGQVLSVSFSSDGSRIASASHDRTVRIWDVAMGEEISVSDKESISDDITLDSPSTPITVPNQCSFAQVRHDELNRIHLFLGRCGTPHFIAPTHISDRISSWEISGDGQSLTVHMEGGGVLTIQAPKRYRCV
ncbi:WD40-repeat-containing domain protein [Cantharellus anzutake]|uniref:WD40-repeat-containing domain protein n=1 Tax=Cantharellus anzutake TaxID=1750568 RepID=UPI0019070C50|nr:WD40-repeat-containing domain protein [Cantharellus anzutake]KAF8338042.1 WD40-repeat-containing domain protein [Cantharellus anzutake]